MSSNNKKDPFNMRLCNKTKPPNAIEKYKRITNMESCGASI